MKIHNLGRAANSSVNRKRSCFIEGFFYYRPEAKRDKKLKCRPYLTIRSSPSASGMKTYVGRNILHLDRMHISFLHKCKIIIFFLKINNSNKTFLFFYKPTVLQYLLRFLTNLVNKKKTHHFTLYLIYSVFILCTHL